MAKGSSEPRNGIEKRLDALIRLAIEMKKPVLDKRFTEADGARLLQSIDFTPTEIAKILGKRSATDVAKYLYGKRAKSLKKEK